MKYKVLDALFHHGRDTMSPRGELHRTDVIKNWINTKPSRSVIDEWTRIKVTPEKLKKMATLKPEA